MGSQITLRTTCCENYKVTGERCSVCPNRLENQLIRLNIAPSAPVTSGNAARRPFRSCFRQPEENPEISVVLGG
ncbi:MAG: hypothetical protein IT170_13220 [Bryobacterales bacterium]|nr:hypothetical protein [Bryobacterales bacterium]